MQTAQKQIQLPLLALIVAGVASAAPYPSREVLFRWDPSSGPVEQYECELADGTLLLTPTAEISFRPWVGGVAVRCRAMDIDGVTSEWSPWSVTHSVRPFPADSTGDGIVSGPDFILLSTTYGEVGWDVEPLP